MDKVLADFAAFGLDPALIQIQTESDFVVSAENRDTVLVFLACSNEWHKEVPGLATQWVFHRLRKTECECIIRNMGYKGKKAREIFAGLLQMESAALPILNKR